MNSSDWRSRHCRNYFLVLFSIVSLWTTQVLYAEENDSVVVEPQPEPQPEPATAAADQPEPGAEPLWKFGAIRLRLAFVKPTFTDDLKFYDELYGKPSNYPAFGFDYSFIRKYLAIGAGMKLAYYADAGHAALNSVDNPTAADISKDSNGPTELTLVPLAAFLNLQFTPFPRKYLVLDGYMGIERLYFQEVRLNTGTTGESTDQKATAPVTVKGTSQSILLGVSANILLNELDAQAVNSMRGSMGLGAIYLSPFVEVVKAIGSKRGAKFDRTNIGIGFTFESTN